MTITLPSRALALSAATAILAVTLVALPATPLTPAETAAADNPSCVGYFDVGNLSGTPHKQTDPDVGTYIGGNLTIGTGSSEMEGTFLVGGDARFNSGAYFNVGTVGAGSQYVPAAGSDMLTVGGDLSISSAFHVEVGNLTAPVGGDVVVGGSVSPADVLKLDLNGGTLTQGGGPAVVAPYAPVAALYSGLSTQFSALADTGTVTTDAGNVNFTSTSTDTRQVFTVAGTVLGSLASTKSINFINMPVDAVIIINVTGTTAVLSANVFTLNGVSITPTAPSSGVGANLAFSHLTQSLLWNFASATSVTLGRQDQLLGSVLVPTAGSNTQVLTSTNGRLYINGDLTLGNGTTESGLEIHNYPFRNCTVTAGTGSLSITKALADPTDVVDNARLFTGTYFCFNSVPAVVASGTWSVVAGGIQTISGIPAGVTCTVAEYALTDPPTAADTSYAWGLPTYSPGFRVIADGTAVNITVTNSLTRQTGSFAITKALTDPDTVVTSGRLFTGTYTCDPQSGADLTGTWSVAAGSTQTVTGVPIGSSCSIVEDALSAPSADPSYGWAAPTYSPSTVTTTGGTVTITATNVVTRGTGSFTIAKALSDPSSVVATGRHFTGTYSCATSSAPVTGTWDVTTTAPQVVSGIPAGSSCSITENALTVGPSATDSSYVWGAPIYSPSTVGITDGGTVTITATNVVRRALGDLELVKVLDDPFDVVSPSRVYTGTFQCIQNSVDVTPAPGTWSTTAGAPAITLATNLPAGTVCTVAEDALTVPPLVGSPQYIWRDPTYSPTTITITDGVTGRFTVTNTVYDPFAILPHMGTDAAAPLLIGGGSIVAGLLAVVFGYRRRRRSA